MECYEITQDDEPQIIDFVSIFNASGLGNVGEGVSDPSARCVELW